MHQSYDGTLQMYVDQPKPIDWEHLKFIRWLCENDKLEHQIAGPIPAWAEQEITTAIGRD